MLLQLKDFFFVSPSQKEKEEKDFCIQVRNISQVYEGVSVLKDISFEMLKPGILMLLGPSGSGKTTLLKMLGGVRRSPLTNGQVIIGGEVCEGPHPDAVTVFQEYATFPWLTVKQNVEFSFKKIKRWRSKNLELKEEVETMLSTVGLLEKSSSYPHQLSGGQRQRLALAQALILKPRILLMDEPFGALDAQTRQEMQALLLELHQKHPCFIVFVTHDIPEALVLGDEVMVLAKTKIALKFELKAPKKVRDDAWLQTVKLIELSKHIRDLLKN